VERTLRPDMEAAFSEPSATSCSFDAAVFLTHPTYFKN